MKRLLAVTLLCVTTSGFAQGVVYFMNWELPSPPDRLVRFFDGTPLIGTNYLAQLYWSTNNGNSFTAVTAAPARFRVPTTSVPGTWLSGNRTLPSGVGGPGQTITLQVRVWDILTGGSYDEALVKGSLAPFEYTQQASIPPSHVDAWMLNFQGGICIIPEPAITLLLLVAAFPLLRELKRCRLSPPHSVEPGRNN